MDIFALFVTALFLAEYELFGKSGNILVLVAVGVGLLVIIRVLVLIRTLRLQAQKKNSAAEQKHGPSTRLRKSSSPSGHRSGRYAHN